MRNVHKTSSPTKFQGCGSGANINNYLNLRKLSAGDFLSLKENNYLVRIISCHLHSLCVYMLYILAQFSFLSRLILSLIRSFVKVCKNVNTIFYLFTLCYNKQLKGCFKKAGRTSTCLQSKIYIRIK
ncbi:hypothetical protein SAMN02745217_02776 [Anaerocolumna xylanovorans DSM 12503]|uniref:Uncharacterized protein n=1 Tax=Anaerocolumna xylanovorans DSM 12503 TaxID=1121345 RepID=A0A1M7YD30_9FIRM|nr:hypothetical protein SAMN02745217_02776 [Anaerocolumna xylanovorans DSM 12503]